MNDNYFDWVLVNQLAIGPAPRNNIALKKLEENNIVSILSLCSIKEALPPKDIEKKFECFRMVLPDHKSKNLITISEINETLEKVEKIINDGPLFIHCLAGIERSPLICMGWLMKKHSLTLEEALTYLMDIHKGTNPLPNQLSILRKALS